MILNEPRGLDKHASRTTAGIVYAPVKRLEDLNQRSDYAGWRVEFSGVLAFLRRELREAILIGAPEDILLVAVLNHLNVCEQINNIAEAAFIQLRAGKVLRQDILESLILLFDAAHGVVDDLSDLRFVSVGGDHRPTGIGRHEENTLRNVFINVFFKAIAFFD